MFERKLKLPHAWSPAEVILIGKKGDTLTLNNYNRTYISMLSRNCINCIKIVYWTIYEPDITNNGPQSTERAGRIPINDHALTIKTSIHSLNL